jgi:TldD protein
MSNNVEQHLLTQSGLSRQDLLDSLALIQEYQIDYADLYFQSSHHESWVLEDGIVKDGSYNIERGVGVRAISGEKTGFSYSDAINKNAITQAALAARSVATKTSQPIATSAIKVVEMDKQIIQPLMPVASISDSEKIDLLKQMDAYIKQIAPDAQQVVCSVAAVYEEVLIAASDGTFATDIRPLIRLNTSVLIEKDGKRERGGAGGGARLDYGYFY